MPTYVLLDHSDFDAEAIDDTALGHEIAHQWFGNLAYIDYDHGNWGEGLTIYFADHADAAARNMAWACRKRMIEGYENSVGADGIPLVEFSTRHNRPTRSIGYGKSAMFFHMIELQIGQEAFRRSVRGFLRTNRYRVAGWDDEPDQRLDSSHAAVDPVRSRMQCRAALLGRSQVRERGDWRRDCRCHGDNLRGAGHPAEPRALN